MRARKPSIVLGAWLAGLTLILSPIITRAQEPKPEGDLAALQGEWTSVNDQGTAYWTFDGNRLSIKAPDRTYEITFTLDPKAKPQKHIDFEVLDGSPSAPGTKAAGIYEIVDQDKIRIAVAAANADRPTDFRSSPTRAFAFDLTKKKD